MRKFRRKHPEDYRECAMAADAWRMNRAGLLHPEIARRLKVSKDKAQDLTAHGAALTWTYELEALPTTLKAAQLKKLVRLESERFPTQMQWNVGKGATHEIPQA